MRTSMIAALAVLIAGASTLAAQENDDGKVRLSGVVIDSVSRAPILHAVVRVDGTRHATVTDSAGRFSLRDLPKGALWLAASRLGYAEALLDIRLTADDTMTIQLAPKPDVLPLVDEIMDKLESRRRRSQAMVRAFEAPQLVDGRTDLRQFLNSYADRIVPCPNLGPAENCVRIRGRDQLVRVYIDEMFFAGAQLERYQAYDFELVEYYTRSAVLRLYSAAFLERVARGKAFISPSL